MNKSKITYPPLSGEKPPELNSSNVTSPIKYVGCDHNCNQTKEQTKVTSKKEKQKK